MNDIKKKTSPEPKLCKADTCACDRTLRTTKPFKLKPHWFLWFLAYCLICFAFLSLGSFIIGFGWFGNGVFSLSSAGVLIWTAKSTSRSRSCPRWTSAALKAGMDTKTVRRVFELAFGQMPTFMDPASTGIGILAYLPLSMLAFKGLGLVMGGVFWRLMLSLIVAIPLAMLLAMLAGKMAAQKAMLDKAQKLVKSHDPAMWNAIAKTWKNRRSKQERSTKKKCRFRGIVVEVTNNVEDFVGTVRGKQKHIGLFVKMADFMDIYGYLLNCETGSRQLNVSSQNGPCHLICRGCNMEFSEAFIAALGPDSVIAQFQGGDYHDRCPKCGNTNAIIVYVPKRRKT